MEDFLKDIGVSKEDIKKMRDDGIDEQVVAELNAEDLGKYLKRYGDCIAAITFAKQLKVLEEKPSKKMSLREKLIQKLKTKDQNDEHVRRSIPQSGNSNAKKSKRSVEIGWLHSYGTTLKQVRSQNGGGTRCLEIQKSATVTEIMKEAIILFFPDGKCKKGSREDFDFYLANQIDTGKKLEEDTTLEDIYLKTKKKLLRLYLVSVTKTKQVTAMNTDNKSSVAEISMCEGLATGGEPVQEINCPQNSLLPSPRSEGLEICPINIPVDIGGSSESRKQDECPINIPINIGNSVTLSKGVLDIPLSVFLDTTQSACLDQLQACDDMELKSIHSFSSQDELSLVNNDSASLQTLNEHENMYSVADESYAENPTDVNFSIVEKNSVTITLHRTLLQEEMLQNFKAREIIYTPLNFQFINECGQDADGVSRDAYSAFWESFFLRNADGETYRVPVLSKDYGQEEWESVGRIMIKGFKDHKYFPITLAPAFVIALVHGESEVTPQILKESFLLYISPSEKEVVEAAMSNFPYDEDELIFLLERFQCHNIPKPDEITQTLLQIAHKTLIQEVKYVIDVIGNIGEDMLKTLFPDVKSIFSLYEQLEPSVSRVLALFNCNPVTTEQNKCLGYLQRFVRGRNKKQLKQLLRFLTGSDIICVNKIDVSFIIRHGKGRLPSVHTCGPLLELPSTYVSYPDFRSEWESILENKDCMEMNSV